MDGKWGDGKRHLYVVSYFEFALQEGFVKMWCTNDGSFVFVVKSVSWVSSEAGQRGWNFHRKSARNGVHRQRVEKPKGSSPSPQERSISLGSVTLLCYPKGFFQGSCNQRTSWNAFWSVIQNI